MSNIEKIKAEIERRKKICEGIFERESDTYYQGKAVAYGELLSFVNSLPEEKPSEDLEKAARNYTDSKSWAKENYLTPYIRESFIAGAEWQAEKCDEETSKLLYAERQTAYINGWDDHKEQMMKDAVEGKVFMSFAPGHNQMVMADVDLPTNTKVKLIIVKED